MLVGFFVAAIILYIYYHIRQKEGLPPGELGLPFIGVIPRKGEKFRQLIRDFRKKYGDIFFAKLGSRIVVFIADSPTIKSCLSRIEFTGRPDFYTLSFYKSHHNVGISFAQGEIWRDNRRFALKHLKDFGLGKSTYEGMIDAEVTAFVNDLKTKVGKPTKIDWSLNVAVLNVIWKIVADLRYDMNDKDIQIFAEHLSKDFIIRDGKMGLMDFYPVLDYILPAIVKNKWMSVDELQYTSEKRDAFLLRIVKEHSKTIDVNQPRDYIDCYLIENNILRDNPDIKVDFHIKNLLACITNFFVAGTETTSTTVRWFFVYMATHPDIQKKLQGCIDEVVPKNRLPCLEDRCKLPYVDAAINDLTRLISLAPTNLVHGCIQDTELNGYKIPKDAVIVTCLEAVHRSSKYWERPDELYPEHFLDKDGNFDPNHSAFYPFSSGRRVCLGEALGKMELFLFISAILQQFTVLPPPGEKLSLSPVTKINFINFPNPFQVVLEKRL